MNIDLVWAADEFVVAELFDDKFRGEDTVFIAESAGVPGFELALCSGSLFAEERRITVRVAEKLTAKAVLAFAEAAQLAPPEVTVRIGAGGDKLPASLIKAFDGVARVQRFPRMRPSEFSTWATRRLTRVGLTADAKAGAALVATVGTGLRDIANACDQLAVRLGKGAKVTPALIADTVAQTAEDKVWTIFDALLAGDGPQAHRVAMRMMDAGNDPVGLTTALISSARALAGVRAHLDRLPLATDNDLAGALGMSPGRAAVVRRQAGNVKWLWLTQTLDQLTEADFHLKGGAQQGSAIGMSLPPSVVLTRALAGCIAD